MKNRTSAIVVLVIGALILVVSVFAGNLGLANVPGLGPQQTIGFVIGALVLAVGVFLNSGSGHIGDHRPPGAENDADWLDSLTKAEEVGADEPAEREGR